MRRSFVALLPLALCLAAPPAAGGVSATDSRGTRVTLAGPAGRIVSLMPSATEILFAIGAGDRVIADTTNCDYPPAARRLPHVSDFFVSVERVLARRPDLVVASSEADPQGVRRLERALPGRVFTADPHSIAELYASIRAIGDITGCRPRADRLVSGMQARAAGVQRVVSRAQRRPAAVFVLGVKPLWVAGGRTFIDEALASAGARNAGGLAGDGYQTCSLERLVAARPEVVFLDRRTPTPLGTQPGWRNMPAARRGAIYVVGLEALRPGPRLIDAIAKLARLVHPELYRPRRETHVGP